MSPTRWARGFAGSYLVGVAGWKELYAKYRSRGLNTNLGGMRDQFICHQQIGAFKKTWNLDEWRRDVSYTQTVRDKCNPSGGGGNRPPPAATTYWVDTFADAVGYSSASCSDNLSRRCAPQGVLHAGRNYVFCKVWGERVGSATRYNHWWLLTDLDVVNRGGRGRAYVSAYYLKHWGSDVANDNAGHTVPNCR